MKDEKAAEVEAGIRNVEMWKQGQPSTILRSPTIRRCVNQPSNDKVTFTVCLFDACVALMFCWTLKNKNNTPADERLLIWEIEDMYMLVTSDVQIYICIPKYLDY
jgi:hypothetical protein